MTGTLFADRPASAPAGEMQGVDACVRGFEEAWRNGERPNIADYLAGGGPEWRAMLSKLIHVDQELRQEAREPTRADPTLPFTGSRQRKAGKGRSS